jgi:hypothetical protein
MTPIDRERGAALCRGLAGPGGEGNLQRWQAIWLPVTLLQAGQYKAQADCMVLVFGAGFCWHTPVGWAVFEGALVAGSTETNRFSP